MFIEGDDGLEIKRFEWDGTTKKAYIFKGGDEVAVIVAGNDRYTVRVYPDPSYHEHWIEMGFSTEECAVAGLRGALTVIADKYDEGLF